MYYVWYRVLRPNQGTFTKEAPLFYVAYWRANLLSYENEPFRRSLSIISKQADSISSSWSVIRHRLSQVLHGSFVYAYAQDSGIRAMTGLVCEPPSKLTGYATKLGKNREPHAN